VKVHFLDTSAFLKRYLKETGSDIIDAIFGEYAARYVSGLCLLETLSNLQRLHSVDGLLAKDHLQLLQAAVASDVESGRVIVVNATPADIEAAVQLLARQYLTAVDALQIAAAKALGPEVVFVSSDVKLNRVAAVQGLTVLDPAVGRAG
jgi:predicted nucleic acid-binding protein